MNAHAFLAALVVVCCAQLSVARIAPIRTLPWHEDSSDLILTSEDKELDRSNKNILSCGVSIISTAKTGKKAYTLIRTYTTAKSTLKKDQEKCSQAERLDVTTRRSTSYEDCVAQAKAKYTSAIASVKAQILPLVFEVIGDILGILKYLLQVKQAFHEAVVAIKLWIQRRAEVAACSSLTNGEEISTCVEAARKRFTERWAVSKTNLAFSAVDLLLGPVLTYFNCTDLLA